MTHGNWSLLVLLSFSQIAIADKGIVIHQALKVNGAPRYLIRTYLSEGKMRRDFLVPKGKRPTFSLLYSEKGLLHCKSTQQGFLFDCKATSATALLARERYGDATQTNERRILVTFKSFSGRSPASKGCRPSLSSWSARKEGKGKSELLNFEESSCFLLHTDWEKMADKITSSMKGYRGAFSNQTSLKGFKKFLKRGLELSRRSEIYLVASRRKKVAYEDLSLEEISYEEIDSRIYRPALHTALPKRKVAAFAFRRQTLPQ